MKLYRIETHEGSLMSVTDRINSFLDKWKNWKTEVELDYNRKTGEYYMIGRVFND